MKEGYTNDETAVILSGISYETDVFFYWRTKAEDVNFDTEILADEIEREIKQNTPDVTGLYGDLLAEALSRVNWYEVAEKFIKRNNPDKILYSDTIE